MFSALDEQQSSEQPTASVKEAKDLEGVLEGDNKVLRIPKGTSRSSVLGLLVLCTLCISLTTYLLVIILPHNGLVNSIIFEIQNSGRDLMDFGLSHREMKGFRLSVKLRPDTSSCHRQYRTKDSTFFTQINQIYSFFPHHHSFKLNNNTYYFSYADSFDYFFNAISNYQTGEICTDATSTAHGKTQCQYLQQIFDVLGTLANSSSFPTSESSNASSDPEALVTSPSIDMLRSYHEIETLELIDAYLQSMITLRTHKNSISIFGIPFNELILDHQLP